VFIYEVAETKVTQVMDFAASISILCGKVGGIGALANG
jgi:hypothetical protein